MIDKANRQISVRRQCELLDLCRSGLYYQAAQASEENLLLMDLIDKEYTRHPFYGSRRMRAYLRDKGYHVNRKRIQRLMSLMGLRAIHPGPKLSLKANGHKIYPYLLKGVSIDYENQVWSSDITYLRIRSGFMYLVAVMDWYSRYVLSWALSNTLSADFCIEALESALQLGKPEIFNSDQGSQFTSIEFTKKLLERNIRISMDGRGRALDNVFIERLWRNVKYEDIYIKEYESVSQLRSGLKIYFDFYNYERPHQSLGYQPPAKLYWKKIQ